MINYMKRIFGVILCLWVLVIGAQAQYRTDILAHGFEQRTLSMPDDYNGKVEATLIRRLSECKTSRALLYVHGYNDYFFQRNLGEIFNDSCFNFYAVDLRKYGRSLLPGQTPFEVRDLSEYFADIDAAIHIIKEEGNSEIILMGHSTGGLITSLYCDRYKNDLPVQGLVLNSPFLDMNQGWFKEKILIPVVSFWGKFNKGTKIRQGTSTAYAESLLKKYHGEWDYNTHWKFMISPSVTSGWIRAIHLGQVKVHKGLDIPCPVLVLFSDKSVYGDNWTPEFQKGDAVLDVGDIAKYGKSLGPKVTEFEVKDGLHDLILSGKDSREAVYREIFRWMRDNHLDY